MRAAVGLAIWVAAGAAVGLPSRAAAVVPEFTLSATPLCSPYLGPAPSPAVALFWSPSPQAILYQVYQDETPVSGARVDSSIVVPALTEGHTYSFLVEALDEQGAVTESNPLDVTVPAGTCPQTAGCPEGAVCSIAGRFQATVHWLLPPSGGISENGAGTPVAISDDTGGFWFFDPSNLDLMVKVLDGTAVNGYFWVFAGSLSNVAYYIDIYDTQTGAARQYYNPAGTLASFADTGAFLGSPPAPPAPPPSGAASPLAVKEAAAEPRGSQRADDEAPLVCGGGAASLCLHGSRFQASVQWGLETGGTTATATAVPLTDGTGYFWFFGSTNAELLVKVLDGTGVNGHFWVFSGALTDVAYTLTILDTQTGAVWSYQNPAGTQASLADTTAF